MLAENESLNQDVINSKIDALLLNDTAIYNSFGNTIGRWHCYWYFDSNIKGYSKGDLVWLNIEDPEKFVKKHYETIKDYTDLRAEVLVKLPSFNQSDDEVVEKYLNALSGYVDSKSPNVKPLEPIFDLGDYSKPIQLAVSLLDNNKKLVSDEIGWKKLFVDDDDSEKIIRDLVIALKDKVLENHLLNYHLSGQEEEVKVQLSDYLDVSEEKIRYDSAPNEWYADYNPNKEEKQYGLDYVTHFIRKPFLVSGEVSQYQAVRYWKSGWIEHFGTIATDNSMFSLSNGMYLKIPFDWKMAGDKSGAKAYESGELAKTLTDLLSTNETDDNLVPPKDNFINVTVERTDISVDNSNHAHPFKDSSYSIVINPIFQNQEENIESDYIDSTYGESKFQQSWNSNFLTNELIEEEKKKNSIVMRLDTRVLAPYLSYYATGMGDFNG